MGTEIATIPVAELGIMAKSIAASGLFGLKTVDQAVTMMLIAQAEGRHPALAARDYDIIQGRPAKKSEAMLRDFMASGGKVEWHALTDTLAEASFSHPQGGTVRISWDMERGKAAGLTGKENWKKFPRQMLRARVVSEGIRTVCPMATSGLYVPEEVQDFEEKAVKGKAAKAEAVTIDQTPQEVAEEPPARKPDPGADIQKLTEAAKALADEIALCDSEDKLTPVVSRYALTMNELSKKLPKWHARLLELLAKQRESFDAAQVPDALDEMLGGTP